MCSSQRDIVRTSTRIQPGCYPYRFVCVTFAAVACCGEKGNFQKHQITQDTIEHEIAAYVLRILQLKCPAVHTLSQFGNTANSCIFMGA